MKKSVVLTIVIVFISSILLVSLFGMKISVYNEDIPVSQIICTNETNVENNITVFKSEGKKIIKIKFTEPANPDKLTGTMLFLEHHVFPDNASNKRVKYIYSENANVEFFKDGAGYENGLVLFYNKTFIDVTIMSTDLRKISTEISIWVS